MRIGIAGVAAIALTVAIAGCTSVQNSANQNSGAAGRGASVSVQAVIDHIKCELYDAARPGGVPDDPALSAKLTGYDAVVLLNLRVNDSGDLAISPNSTAQYGVSRERTFTQTYRFSISNIVALTDPKDCGNDAAASADFAEPTLQGDLGIAEVARVGIEPLSTENASMVSPAPFDAGSSYASTTHSSKKSGRIASSRRAGASDPSAMRTQASGICASSDPARPSFGSSIAFVVTRGVVDEPSWPSTHVRSVAAVLPVPETNAQLARVTTTSSDGLHGTSRVDTNQLWISFEPQKNTKLTKAMRADIEGVRHQEANLATLDATIASLRSCHAKRLCLTRYADKEKIPRLDMRTNKLLIASDLRLRGLAEANLRTARATLDEHTKQYMSYASATDCESHSIINTMIFADE